jgi:hypothetical protein
MAAVEVVFNLKPIADTMPGKVNMVVRKLTLDLLARTILRTPVDTGLLRGNWQVSIGTMSSQLKSARDPSGNAALAQGSAKINAREPGATIFIVNPLPYARVIEDGLYPNPPKRGTYVSSGKSKYGFRGPGFVMRSQGGFSKQAPKGVVRISAMEIKAEFDQVVRSLKNK